MTMYEHLVYLLSIQLRFPENLVQFKDRRKWILPCLQLVVFNILSWSNYVWIIAHLLKSSHHYVTH